MSVYVAGPTWVVRTPDVESVRPAPLGDRLAERTCPGNFTRATGVRHDEFSRNVDPAVIARGRTGWGFVDAGTGRPGRLPPDVRRRIGADADDVGPAVVR